MQHFMLNLHQLNHAASKSNSDAQHFSRFSVSFRIPSNFLENIGEPLDHGQSKQMEENDDRDHCVVRRADTESEFEEAPVQQLEAGLSSARLANC